MLVQTIQVMRAGLLSSLRLGRLMPQRVPVRRAPGCCLWRAHGQEPQHEKRRRPGRRCGFTLTEVMMAAVVVGVLAGMALPSYIKMVERGYWQSSQDVLLTIYTGERNYFFNNGVYKMGLTKASPNNDWRAIKMDNPNLGSIPITYSVDPPRSGDADFTATAQRGTSTRKITIDSNREWCHSGSSTIAPFTACAGAGFDKWQYP